MIKCSGHVATDGSRGYLSPGQPPVIQDKKGVGATHRVALMPLQIVKCLLHVGDLLDVLLDRFDAFVRHQEMLGREGDDIALFLHL